VCTTDHTWASRGAGREMHGTPWRIVGWESAFWQRVVPGRSLCHGLVSSPASVCAKHCNSGGRCVKLVTSLCSVVEGQAYSTRAHHRAGGVGGHHGSRPVFLVYTTPGTGSHCHHNQLCRARATRRARRQRTSWAARRSYYRYHTTARRRALAIRNGAHHPSGTATGTL
jgi:hypothetical protein